MQLNPKISKYHNFMLIFEENTRSQSKEKGNVKEIDLHTSLLLICDTQKIKV